MNRYEDDRIFPISQSQSNIWKLEQLYPHNPMNNICTSIRIKGRIDIALAARSINSVLEKDLSLRMRMATVNGKLVQYHVPYKEEQFPFFNFSMTDEEGFSRWENTIAQVPMPICDSPLYQFSIYKFDEKSGGILIKVHHLIADGWSIVDLANRLSSAYLALLSRKEFELPDMPSYERHVAQEREYFASEAFDTDRAYWAGRIAEFEGERAFLKKNSNVNVSNAGDRCSFKFSELTNHAIAAFCRSNRIAPFAVYCIALAVHLRRMSGFDRACIGVPIVNRAEFTDKQAGGMFVNTLPFFFRVNTALSAQDMIFDLTEQWYALLRHQRFPFSEIFALAGQNRADGAPNRLFDIVLSYQDSKIFRDRDTTMLFSGKWLYSGYQNEQLIIHLSSLDGENRFAVDYDYQTQIFSREDICDLHNHVTQILTEILLNQNLPAAGLNLLDESELERVLYTFNNTKNDYLSTTIGEEFLKVAAGSPGKAALICKDAKLTFGELYRRAAAVAGHIRSVCGSLKEKENVVALCLPRGFDLLAFMLGAALSDNAWVVFPSDLPAARLLQLLRDCGAATVITTEAFGAVFEQASIPVVLADKLDWSWDGAELPCRARGEDLAYVVYTSGSTGTPKGVMIEQGALVNFARAMDGIFANGGVLSVCNTGFDVFVLETVAALLCGRTVILVPDEYSNDPAVLADLIKRYAANCFAVTPSRLEAYLGNPDFMQAVGSVESIICGGEPLTGDFINRLERLTKARIYNQYGASETTIGVSCKCLNQSPSITAGKPMANCRLYVLDDNRNPLPVGAVGTLYVGGVCVGRGYINNDEATEKNFVADPFEIDGRMYNTGDLARWEKSGEITILGRRDAQVKLNGHRIEPQEISSVLLTHPAVGQAAVQITKQENSGCITAYYTSPAELGEDELYEACASLLPEYMIPRFFIRVDVIPLTPNGKTDFAALPAPAPIVQTGSADKKTSKSEQAVLDVFKRVLKQDGLTADSGYFQSGGDSLNALTALLEIARLPGGEAINPTDLRRLATPAKIAEKMDKSRTDPQAAPAKNKLAPVSRASYPLTAIQKSILFSSFSDPTGIAYNMPGGFELPWTPDKQALENAVTGLIASEDVFRTAFTFEGAEAVAKILPSAPFRLETVAGNAYEDACRAFVRPFDLAHPPLIRAGLWERNGRAVLLVDVHHMINDGEGTALLLGRLDRLYRGEKPQNAGLSYKDYACYLDEKTDKTVIDAAYWKQKLSPAPGRLNLSQKPENGVSDAAQAGGALSVKMDRALSDGINKYCRENNMTAYTFLAAALGVLLSGLSGQTDFVIGTPVAGRDLPETRGMLGAFIHTLPLRMNVDRGQTAADYLRTVAADAADMLGHNSVTQEQLLSLAGGGNGYSGLYNVMFSMHPDYRQSFTLGGRKLTYLPVKTGTVKMDLVLEAFKAGPEYTISLEYAAALFGENAVALYARSLTVIAEGMIQHPARRIGDLRLLSDADHKAALKAAAGEAVPYIHAMLDVMADTFAYNNPNADAVVFGDGRMSYDAFRKRSDGIAAQLMHCGVKRGDAVGVYCGRTPDLLCGVFGILKCGAAYLPLSDALPKERIQQMLDSAGARAVLCDGGHAADASIDEKYIKCVISDESPEFTPVSGRNAGDLAQVLFTSGSTGQPKGVTISHRSLSGLLVNLKQIYGGGGALGGVLCSSSVLFDSFTMEAVIPLALGLSVVLADQTEIMNPRMLAARLKKSGVQAMFSTPSRIRVLLGDDLFSKAVSKLKVLLVGGEPMPEPLAKKLKAVCPGDVYNLYGPAEATVFVTSWKVNEAEPVAIGRPVANARVYVLDEKMRPVLPGAVGEIHIGGDCLSNGYIGRDDLTRAAFIDNPFAPGEKLYCTGDLARVLDDGRVDYLGRKDGQIKLNGQRIELEEISGAIVNTGMALDAAVVAVKKGKDQHAGVSLRAFVVPVRNRPFDEAILRGELGKALPQYMVPGEIVVIETIPLTATGKTDTRALTEYESGTQNDAPDEAADGADGAGIAGSAPGTDGESRVQAVDAGDINAVRTALLSLWKEVLGADRIDCGRSFFEQGGTSLACMNLLIRYFKYGWEIKLNIFYEKPTLNEQADLIMSIYGQSNAAQEQTSAEAVPAVVQTLSAAGQDCAPILITGATGFFGAHIVYELANQCRGDIYCLVRGAPKRLYEVLETYFTEQWVGDNQARIVPIIGDIAEPDLGVAAQKYNQLTKKIKTVYHCAADVRHYMSENEAERANVGGTRNVVAFCERAGAYLVFVSTLSVGGEKIERAYEGRYPGLTEVEFDESSFDIGQNWRDNVYVRSKFLAEQEVQKAAGRGLEAVILRVGRLVGRASDGRFQINKEANYFYNVITGIARLGMVPEGVCDTALELTPVDACAKAAVLLTSGRITGAAHLASPYTATIAAAVGALVNGGIAEKDLRYRKLTRIGLDAYKKMVLSGASGASPSAVLQDASMLNSSLALNTNGFIRTKITSGATDERLRRMGFAWPAVDIALLLREFMQMQNQETPEAGA